MTDAIGNRVVNMILRGRVKAWENTARGFRKIRLALVADEPSDVHLFMPYGFTSRPPVESDALAFQPSGNADHLVALVAGRGPDLNDGESAQWNAQGWWLALLSDGVKVSSGDGATQRLRIKNSSIVLGTDAAHPAVVRDGDSISITGLSDWANQVTVSLAGLGAPVDAFPPPGTGTVAASSTKVFAE